MRRFSGYAEMARRFAPKDLNLGDAFWSSQGWQIWDGREFYPALSSKGWAPADLMRSLDLTPLAGYLKPPQSGRAIMVEMQAATAESRITQANIGLAEHWDLSANIDGDTYTIARIPRGVSARILQRYDTEGGAVFVYDRSDTRSLTRVVVRTRRVAGIWDYYGNPPPTPEPQPKSPQDKALDDFIAKRKAKREAKPTIEPDTREQTLTRQHGQSLDRAMSKLAPHHHDMHTRLMPFKVVL